MKEETITISIEGKQTKVDYIIFEESDREKIRKLYNQWCVLNQEIKKIHTRGVNFPEGISEPAFCLCFGENYGKIMKVYKGSSSFDVINIKNGSRIQIKATSSPKSPTSFGPKSVWDEIYFLDFYREGEFDGTFDVYKLEDEWIYNRQVNIKQTFREQQKEDRRPRFIVKSGIINPKELKPIKTCTI